MDLGRDQLLQFLPPRVADAVLSSDRDLLAGRREEVSVLSCDVAAFRPRAEADPGAAFQALNDVLGALARAILDGGGTLMSFPGDGALAVFGAPIATPDHAAAAEEVRARLAGPVLERVNEHLTSRGVAAVKIDVAVASGPATVGVIGAGPRWEYAAIGDVTAAAIAVTSG